MGSRLDIDKQGGVAVIFHLPGFCSTLRLYRRGIEFYEKE